MHFFHYILILSCKTKQNNSLKNKITVIEKNENKNKIGCFSNNLNKLLMKGLLIR